MIDDHNIQDILIRQLNALDISFELRLRIVFERMGLVMEYF
jgi:hypothetical protein